MWKPNCELDKSYNHIIVRRMRMDKFNEPSLEPVKSLSHGIQQILVLFYLAHFVFICTFPYLTISVLLVPSVSHIHFVFLTLAVKLFSRCYAGF